jgi:hypothetical protein
MTAAERNQATLVDPLKHLGPGLDVRMDACRRSLSLSRAYTKLGIEGRGQLPSALDREKTRVPTL